MVGKCVQTLKQVIDSDSVYLIEDRDCLTEVYSAAQELLKNVNSSVPKEHGIPIIESCLEKGSNLHIKPLPKRKYGKPKQPGAQRFGLKAEAQKK